MDAIRWASLVREKEKQRGREEEEKCDMRKSKERERRENEEKNRKYITTHSISHHLLLLQGDSGGGTIMGDVFMQNFAVVFDRTNMKVGFGELNNCPSNVDRSHLPKYSSTPYGAKLRKSPRAYQSAHHDHGVLSQA
jgi:hypothetical protein